MRRLPVTTFAFALVLAGALVLAPGLAMARLGGGSSMGSRGGMTYSAPPSTNTAPGGGMSMQRSMTPRSEPSPGFGQPGLAQPGYGGFGRSSFTSGLLGGLVGAGIGGMLFGHGMFGGLDGGTSFIGLLIQFALLFFIGRWLFRLVMARQPMLAGGGMGGLRPVASGGPRPVAAGSGTRSVTITDADYKTFEQLLRGMQAAWSNGDLNALRSVATPEMTSYFGEQLAELTSRGLRNQVSEVRLEQGDLAQAWADGSREYATVAMRFSMLDVTQDASGRVVDGSATERQSVAELWTFLRAPGGRWLLSAIQQTR